jgi:hypothetical protein
MALDLAGRRATRVAKIALDLMWWAGLALSGIATLLFLLSPLVIRDSGFRLGVGVPVSVAAGSGSTVRPLTSADTMRVSQPVLEAEPRTRLEFHTRDWGFFALAHVIYLPLIAAALAAGLLLRRMLADVLSADVFTARNAARLWRVGWLVILLSIAAPALERWRASLILGRTRLSGASLSPSDWDGSGLWFMGVLFLVLASAWRYGVELQQDRDLTV